MTKPAPLWQNIRDTLYSEIAQGAWRAGARLPTEAALAQRFDVNRHTVRRALQSLADEGLVQARRGAGVFVLPAPLRYPIGARTRFRQNLLSAGRSPSRRLLHLARQAASAPEAQALGIARGAPVHIMEAISMADDLPISLARSCFCATRFPDLDTALRATGSVTAALAQMGISDYLRKSTRLTAQTADPVQARHLQISSGDMLILSEAINVDISGLPIEFGRSYFVGSRVELVLESDGPAPFVT
ncbi:GntR family phosphonate transport system transcriptional regulator [Roseinatronobacter thiooxidans]|uniref:GntR family phosphonate transport system transcriptional regulator n=1 Tax=Roseinatronobacter thiooxidans TaxID=121821 RepID=A0A2W7PPE2_9RHOB|nr:phosphonate metabolism transcriptional regulator PhnF [Roseinatronobacter thiooxidans]PZX38008.1 GntR family phosphonate transport system transcriptional regulator [Roseinatronobacter thiooxidans]